MILPIALTAAAAAALINIWLSVRVSRLRGSEKVMIGDGGSTRLMAGMRAHANFVEYTPFVLIMIALIELSIGSAMWLWVVSGVYLMGAHISCDRHGRLAAGADDRYDRDFADAAWPCDRRAEHSLFHLRDAHRAGGRHTLGRLSSKPTDVVAEAVIDGLALFAIDLVFQLAADGLHLARR